MRVLLHSFQQSLYVSIPPPWNPRNQIPQSTITKTLTNSTKSHNSHLRLNAKGFSGSPAKEDPGNKLPGDKDDDDKELPEAVFNRIIARILGFVGVPMAIGLILLKVFATVKEQNIWDFPKWVPFLTTFLTFGASTLGIAYGALSASWDEENKGTVFGWDEAKKNWVDMWKEENETD